MTTILDMQIFSIGAILAILLLVLIYRSAIKNQIIVLHKDGSYTTHTFAKKDFYKKEEIDYLKITVKGKEENIVLPSSAIFTNEKIKMGFPKISKLIILRGNEISPITYDKEVKDSTSVRTKFEIMKLIVRSHILGEWLYLNKKEKFMYVLMLVVGLLLGLMAMAVLYPHLFASTIASSGNGGLPK